MNSRHVLGQRSEQANHRDPVGKGRATLRDSGGPARSLSSLSTARAFCRLALVIVWYAFANTASAGETTYLATVSVHDGSVRYEMSIDAHALQGLHSGLRPMDPAIFAQETRALQRAVDGKLRVLADTAPCNASPSRITAPASGATNVQIAMDFTCPASFRELTIRYELFDSLGGAHRALALIVWPGGTQQFMFAPDAREVRLDLALGTINGGATSFVILGAQRMLTGWDYLLFLLCLILPLRRFRDAPAIVLAFAAAHSLAIVVTGLGIASLPASITGVAIALSITYVAGENILLNGITAVAHRWLVASGFGLFHGFSLASSLNQIGLPRDGALFSVLRFNLGVEIGAGIFVLIAAPLLAWIHRNRWDLQAIKTISGLALAIGIAILPGRVIS